MSGSKHGAGDDAPWIAELGRLVAARVASGRRTVGFCFGAQLMAQALGGAATPAGYWELGTRELDFPNDASQKKIRVHQLHRDAVSTLPPGAVLLASSRRCEHEIWSLGARALAIQGHPEMSEAVLRGLIESRADLIGKEAVAEALVTFDANPVRPSDTAHLVTLCKKYLKKEA